MGVLDIVPVSSENDIGYGPTLTIGTRLVY